MCSRATMGEIEMWEGKWWECNVGGQKCVEKVLPLRLLPSRERELSTN